MEDDYLKKSLQENLLVLLCFGEDKTAKLLVSNLKYNYFDNSYYREIAKRAIDFILDYETTIKEHLPELLEDELNNVEKGRLYQKVLENIYSNKDKVNTEFVLDDLNNFIKMQQMKMDIKDTAELLHKGKIDEAESKLYNSKRSKLELFEPGIFFGKDRERTLAFKENIKSSQILTGIPSLDNFGHVPTKKELYTAMGRAGRGKSWFLIYLAKMALLQRKKVLHLSLEMGYERILARYLQAFFALGTRKSSLRLKNIIFKEDEFGYVSNLNYKVITKNIRTLEEDDIEKYLDKKLDILKDPNLLIKCFPTGTLTVEMLESFLNNLEFYSDFVPDMILLDYLDLMNVNIDNKRNDLSRLGIELRGIANRFNAALVNVAQTNRVAEGIRVLTRKFLGEDFTKVQTTDVFITLNSTEVEKELGLLRIFVDKGRNEQDGQTILISNNLTIGQFYLSSCLMDNKYNDLLNNLNLH